MNNQNIYIKIIKICFFFIIAIIFITSSSEYIQASCSVSCTGTCAQLLGGCKEGTGTAGCGYGLPDPDPGYAWCCPYKVTCTCTPGACGGCTPTCASGQSTTVSGPLCATGTNSSCTGSNGCTSCTLTGTECYYLETNTAFIQSNLSTDGPSSVSMIVDDVTYVLSTDPNNPTHIKLPANGSSDVQVSVPTFTAPTTSRGANYYFQANNYGVDGEWETWTTCSGTDGEDFCTTMPNSNNTQAFVPTSKTVNQVLKENALGQISAKYATTDKCADTYKYSVAIEGYYVVDIIPDEEELELGTIGDITSKGCTSTTYTGQEINNPLHVVLGATDTNSNDEIQAMILWFSKDNTVPTSMNITTTCNAGYYYAADNICCPTNTTYSNGVCIANSTSPVCVASNSYRVSSTQCCKNGTTFNGELCNGTPYPPTFSCQNGYIKVTSSLCCPVGSGFDGSMCTNPKSTPIPATVPYCTGGTYYSAISRCCPLGTYYNSSTYKCVGSPTPVACPVGYTSAATGICCPINTTYQDGMCKKLPSGLGSGATVEDAGIMIKKNGTTWDNPNIYSNDSLNNWRLIPTNQDGNKYIKIAGTDAMIVKNLLISQTSNVTFNYDIEFLTDIENLSGMYNIYGEVLDSYMINGANIDQSYLQSLTDWGIDLVNPTVNDITQEVKDSTNTYITWSAVDTISGIGRTVINAYRTGGTATDDVTLYLPDAYTTSKGSISLQQIPAMENIGLYAGTNAWVFTSSTGEKDELNIGNNEEGNINVYTTTYDLACNTDSDNEDINLNPWFATRGGSVYSKESITATPKEVSTALALDGVFSAKTQMTKEKIDLGTELLTTQENIISQLTHGSTSGAVRSISTYDSNDSKGYWFDTLVEGFNKYKNNSTEFTQITTSISADCVGDFSCYYISNPEEDISIPSGYTCDQPALIVSNQDIYIEPNVESGSNLSGCIFLAKNNIYIRDGEHVSDTKVMYDYLEGFFIADNQIIFSLSEEEQIYSVRDGIEIYGGLVAFGSNISDDTNAVSIERSMRLFNQTNPALVVSYDNKYLPMSTIYFGQQAIVQKQEIGFKSF